MEVPAVVCKVCDGSGKRQARWRGSPVVLRCHGCAGRGKVNPRKQNGLLRGPSGGQRH